MLRTIGVVALVLLVLLLSLFPPSAPRSVNAFSPIDVPSARTRNIERVHVLQLHSKTTHDRARSALFSAGSSDGHKTSSSLDASDKNSDTADTTKQDDGGLGIDPSRLIELFREFKEMALPYYQESKSGRWLFAGMIGITLLNSGVSVAFSYVGKDFWNALSSKDAANFYPMLAKYAAALVVGMPVSVLYRFQRERLAVAWREWITDRTLQLYSSNRVYYALERGGEVDNPDQRIAEDVRSFTAFSLQLFITIVTSSY